MIHQGGGPEHKKRKTATAAEKSAAAAWKKDIWRMAVLCACCVCLAGNVAAQSGSITVPSRETTLKGALEELQRQTGYLPVINYDNIEPSRKVTLSSDNPSVVEFMRQVLAGTGFTHEMAGRHMLVVPEPPKIDDGAGAISAMWLQDDLDEPVDVKIITFRTGSATPEPRFMENAGALDEIESNLVDSVVVSKIDHISVTAASSPDGNTAGNERLAIRRAQETKGYLAKRYPHIAPEKIYPFSVGEEWSGLRKLVSDDERTPFRDRVLEMLDSLPEEVKRDSLRAIGGGRAWRYIAANLLPRLRGAATVTLHFKNPFSGERLSDTVNVDNIVVREIGAGSGVQRVEIMSKRTPPPPVEEVVAVELPAPEIRPLFAVKTNLLFDVASALNLEIEVPVGRKWSIAAEGIFPWWMFVSGTLEARYWLGDRSSGPPLTGWFAGAYFGGGTYDFNRNSTGYRGDFLHAGLSGGYAHKVNRSGNLRMEYSLGLGYLWGTRGPGNQRDNYNWIGPTRAKVSLVLMLNRKPPAQ